jgi:3-oxoacyl-[acyl-carrier-protein] synthase-3
VLLNIDRFGNTSCTTIPLLIATEMQNIFKGNNSQRCLLSGFGVGLSWGNCFVELNNIIISDLVEI